VIDSRVAEDGASIRRRRACAECGYRFTTFERAEEVALTVRKRDRRREPFSAAKVTSGIALAVKGRPITAQQVADIVSAVENAARSSTESITTQAVGEMVLGSLKDLDAVSAMRFASVYKHFEDLADFERAATELSEP
jgi:transcriptional repressor NrdR